MKILTRYAVPAVRPGVLVFADALITQQQFKDECDLNVMVKRFGSVPPPAFNQPVARYGDFSSVPEFHAAQDLLIRAREQFAALPARVRDRFHNDPAELLAFVGDKANLKEANDLGLLSSEAAARLAAAAAAPAEGAK